MKYPLLRDGSLRLHLKHVFQIKLEVMPAMPGKVVEMLLLGGNRNP